MGIFVNRDADRILHAKVLRCPGCSQSLLPGDRGWHCDIIGHHTGFDSDEMVAHMLKVKTGESLMDSMRRVKKYRAFAAGKTREEVRAILEKGKPIMDGMKADMDALHAAVGAVLTPAQKAWFDAHRRQDGGPLGRPMPGRKP